MLFCTIAVAGGIFLVLDMSQPFGYETSDLKNVYLSRYELQSRMMAPALTQYQYLAGDVPTSN
jgi:hypothetical protein